MRAKTISSLTTLLRSNTFKQYSSSPLASFASLDILGGLRHSSNTTPSNESAATILQSLQGAEFQHHLEQLRQQTGIVEYSKLLSEFCRSTPTATEEDAARVCEALDLSGAIMRHGSLVYLRPMEIASALRRVLPMDVAAAAERLREVDAALAGLEEQRTSIIQKASLRTKALNYVFFVALASQWGLLFRLTYWELSWDVIEPIGFFVQGLTAVASYAYFLRTQRDFTFEGMHQRWMTTFERKAFEEADFDVMEYNRLKQEALNLRDVLDAQQERQQQKAAKAAA